MPFYQYSVRNNQGQTVLGTLQADNVDAARSALVSGGYAVDKLEELASSNSFLRHKPTPAAPAAKAVTPAPAPKVQPVKRPAAAKAVPTQTVAAQPAARPVAPQRRPETPGPGPHLNAIPDPAPQKDFYKTKYGNDKDLFFLFSQLGSYFRSGINPAQGLTDLSRRVPARYQDSLKHAASVVSEGGRMSTVLEKYPYLYPPDVVGTVRAGEAAGFMPDAMEEVASKMEISHRLKRRLKYFNIMFILTIASAPMVLGTIQGGLKSMELQDQAGGNLPAVQTVGKSIGVSLFHDLPVTLLIFGALWALYAWFNSMPMRRFRHVLVIRTPVIGGRAMAESMARLTWAMGMVSKAGLSPQQTFQLALQAVPNQFVRERLRAEGEKMTESDKLSSALRRSALLPVEYGNIVETGEVTGDVPRALDNVAKATDADFQGRNATAIQSSGWIFSLILAVLVLVLCAWLLRTWYDGIFRVIKTDG